MLEENNRNKRQYESSNESEQKKTLMAVFGLGGAGGNALTHIINSAILDSFDNVDFYSANTDLQALYRCGGQKIELGKKLTGGFGAGGDPQVGREATLENSDEIQKIIQKYELIILVAGLGGGTGSGAIGVIAEVAKNLGILCICAVTKPFRMEGALRNRIADAALNALLPVADSVIVTSNENLKRALDPDITLIGAFKAADDMLANSIRAIAALINYTGMINVDFNDIVSVTRRTGLGVISISKAQGELRAKNATTRAIYNPLMDNVDIKKAKGILVNVTAGIDLKLSEYEIVGEVLEEHMGDNTKVILGTSIDADLRDEMEITLILTGISQAEDITSSSNAGFDSGMDMRSGGNRKESTFSGFGKTLKK